MASDENVERRVFNRFELIDHRGPCENHHRAVVVSPTESTVVTFEVQDDGRTLKVFLQDQVD